MDIRQFGTLGYVSSLSLGGGGLGELWGATTREECIATVHEAVDRGITLCDMAPVYGNGEAETVIGETFKGSLPGGLRITTKCRLGDIRSEDVGTLLDESIDASLKRMNIDHVDIFFLHNWITSDDAQTYGKGTRRSIVERTVIPEMERIVKSGKALSWGLTGIGDPKVLIDMFTSGIRPDFIQIITNLLDSPGALQYPDSSSQPRDIIAAAHQAGTSIMGIRAVQAGALTSKIDRFKPADDPESLDFRRADPFRSIARDVGKSPAFLAHQYALSMEGPATIVLGVKNREELRECIAAEAAGPLDSEFVDRIDLAVSDNPYR